MGLDISAEQLFGSVVLSIRKKLLVSSGKSFGLLAGIEEVVTGGVHNGFAWLVRSQSCKYHGFQVELDISAEQQFGSVVLFIRKKLTHWSSSRLSCTTYFDGQPGSTCLSLVHCFMLLTSFWYNVLVALSRAQLLVVRLR